MQSSTFSILNRALCVVVLCSLAACGVPPLDVSSGSGATAVASAVTIATTAPTFAVTPSILPISEATMLVPTVTIVPTDEPTAIEAIPTPTEALTVVTPTLVPAMATVDTTTAAVEATAEATVAVDASATPEAVDASATPEDVTIDDETYLTLRGDAIGRPIRLTLWRTDVGLIGNYVDLAARAATGLESTTWVSGTLDDAGNVSLRNADADAPGDNPPVVVTGTLTGDEVTGIVLEGTWTEGRETVDVPVRLTEVRPDTKAYTLASNTVEQRDDARNATYTVTYPVLTGAGAAGDAFNQRAAGMIDEQRDAFKANVEVITPTLDTNDPASQTFMQIRYELASANDRYISVLFEMNSYSAGAAHPNTNTVALTYDLANNREVALADLFKPDSDYLQFLSSYSLEKLRTRTEMELFEEGAAPKAENFRSWAIDQDGITIVFDAYNVAAYVYGPQVIFIPFDQMRDLLASDSVVASGQ